MKTSLLAAASLSAALLWIIALIVDGRPWETSSVLLIGIGVLGMATVSTVGIIVAGGRWAHRLGLGTVVAMSLTAIFRPVDVWWVVAMAATALATVSLLSPSLTANVRKLPAATGPSARAIAPAITLLVAPLLIGLVGDPAPTWAVLTVGLSAPIFAFLYSRVLSGGLLGVRVVWPLVAVATAPTMGWLVGLTSTGLALTVATLAWGRDVKASFHPPLETGTTFPIPPELAPTEVLDAAEIDEHGQHR